MYSWFYLNTFGLNKIKALIYIIIIYHVALLNQWTELNLGT